MLVQQVGFWAPRVGAVLFAAAMAAAVTVWAIGGRSVSPPHPIAEQWIDAVSQFGIEPLYPPQEDFVVGDVLAFITDDALRDVSKDPLPKRSIKLVHIDLSQELETTYGATYQFPQTKSAPEKTTDIWTLHDPATESLFKTGGPRRDLPLALFPAFSVARLRAAEIGSSGIGAIFGLDASGDATVEMKVDGVETYGIPAIPAELALIRFCTAAATAQYCRDHGARVQLSMLIGQQIFDQIEIKDRKEKRPRYSVEIGLVSRVYLARSVESIVRSGSTVRSSMRLGAQDASSQENSPPKIDANGATPTYTRPKELSLALSATASQFPAAITGAPTPGGSTTVRQTDSHTLSITKILSRPIAFGFRTVRWMPGK